MIENDTEQTEEPLHILELRGENFKRLRAVRLYLDGKSVVIGGRNGQGKSSTLDLIEALLKGAHSIPGQPIRAGQRRANGYLDLGEIKIKRDFTLTGSKLVVTAKDGSNIKSPQTLLSKLWEGIGFDPLEFTREDQKKQADTLRKIVGLDLSVVDAQIREAFDARGLAKKVHARAVAVVEAAGMPPAKAVRKDVSELVAKLQAAEAENRGHEAALRESADLGRRAAASRARAADLRAQADAEDLKAEQLEVAAEEKRPTQGPVDTAALAAEVSQASETNARADAYERWLATKAEQDRAEDELRAAEDALEEARAKREEMIRSAKYPIEGLQVADDGVIFRGVPLKQASQAEQLRVSAAIGMALNPRLKVMLIRDGAFLDKDNLRGLLEHVHSQGFQVLIERVGDDETVGIVIEDGEVIDDRSLVETTE